MVKVPFLDLPAQDADLRDTIVARLAAICESGQFVLGPEVERFENNFAAFCETPHCVGVNSGTSALHLALRCLDTGPGDEVITVPMTFVATTWAISYVGATPLFVDIDPVRRTLDPKLLEAAITPRTRAIMPVHLYGQPADMEPILRIAAAHRLPVIEDAAQAHGARVLDRPAGSLGVIGCYSFYPGKNLGAYGEAGALVTHDGALAERARMLRNHAQSSRYHHDSLGYNYRMDAFQAAVLDVKLQRLADWTAARRRHAQRYLERLREVPGVVLPLYDRSAPSVFHLFVIEVDDRDRLAAFLAESGIQTGLHYPVPVHLQPAYRDLGHGEGSFPIAERLARRCLSLPLHPQLTEAQIDLVCDRIGVFFQR